MRGASTAAPRQVALDCRRTPFVFRSFFINFFDVKIGGRQFSDDMPSDYVSPPPVRLRLTDDIVHAFLARIVVPIWRFGTPADSDTARAFMCQTMALKICVSQSDFMAVFLVFLLPAGWLSVIIGHNGTF